MSALFKHLLVLRIISMLLTASLSLSGCAMSEGNADRAQGTAIGAGAGAVIGGGLGYLLGGKTGAIVLGSAGALIGGSMGYQWGKHVALKKAAYASQEDYITANTQRLDQMNSAAMTENEHLSSEVAAQNAQADRLLAAYNNNEATAEDLHKQAAALSQEREGVQAKIAVINQQITESQDAYNEAQRHPGNEQSLKEMDDKIQALTEQKEELVKGSQQLSSISNRLSI